MTERTVIIDTPMEDMGAVLDEMAHTFGEPIFGYR